jgi:DNA topoisomerase-1
MKDYIYRNIKTIKNNKYTYNFYDKKGNKINKKSINKYLKNIYIPPAYNNVMINKNINSKILVIGIDKKGRKQYIYNKKLINKNSKNKFKKLINFGKNYKKIITKINRDLNSNKKEKLIALILKIIIECDFRIGNEKYLKDNNSHGVSTLKNNHILINNNKIIIDFIGKKGVRNLCEVKDNIIIKNLKTLKKKK